MNFIDLCYKFIVFEGKLADLGLKITSRTLQNPQLYITAETYSFPNIIKTMETVLSIPISNDTVEQVFSLMKRIWNERNSMNTGMVKAEICINFNF